MNPAPSSQEDVVRGFRNGSDRSVRHAVTAAVLAVAAMPLFSPPAHAANPRADLDQCENGEASAPKACTWVDGNLNAGNSHFGEGDSIPYRIAFTDLAVGSHTVTIQWDTTKGGKHALDYLTSYDRTEPTADPCAGVSGCTLGAATTFPIPDDPAVGPQVAGVFSMWNGAVTAASAYTVTGSYASDSATALTITFTATGPNPVVLAYSGHIATRLDWGSANSASRISGSPYHMRLLALDGSGGNQDRSVSAEAVVFSSSITIVKQATPEGARSFAFTASDGLGNFTLVDDGDDGGAPSNFKKFSGLTDFYTNTSQATYDFTETVPVGWQLSSIACGAGADVTTDVATATLSVKLAEGTDVVCTFATADVAPPITVIKTPSTTTVTEPGGDVTFDVDVTNDSTGEPLTLTALDDDVYGDVTALGDTTCAVPQVIAAGGTYSCSFTEAVAGNAGHTHTNVVDATVEDGDGNEITEDASATVVVQDRAPDMAVTKTPSTTTLVEPGGNVTFTVDVTNETAEALTVTGLDDTDYDDVADAANPKLGSTTCALPHTVAGNGTYSCTFSAFVAVDAPTAHRNTVTATGQDDEGNGTTATGTAEIAVTDLLPSVTATKTPDRTSVPEPGGDVSFTVAVTNGTAEPVTLYELADSDFGALSGSPAISASNCALPQALAGSATYTCIFTATVAGDAAGDDHRNTVTARVRDDEANEASATASADVVITDVAPAVSVTKVPRVSSVSLPGAEVTFDLVVTNQSVEPVTLYELADSVYGNLATLPSTTCSVPVAITKPGAYACSFTAFVGGRSPHENVVTARVRDNEGGTASGTAAAMVEVTDAKVAIDKSANPASATPGQTVVYTYLVTNPGDQPLRGVTVTDDKCAPVAFVAGDADADAVLDVEETWAYTCSVVVGSSVGALTNIGTVTATAPSGATVSAQDTETITVVLGVTLERPHGTVAGVELARTGRELVVWATTGGTLLASGVAFLVVGRRQRRTS